MGYKYDVNNKFVMVFPSPQKPVTAANGFNKQLSLRVHLTDHSEITVISDFQLICLCDGWS